MIRKFDKENWSSRNRIKKRTNLQNDILRDFFLKLHEHHYHPQIFWPSVHWPSLCSYFLPLAPYEIFVRDLVAVDGVDSSEIVLIDSNGCPTDPTLMSVVTKANGNSKALVATFEAFKFPTSNIVQFRAVVTPCLFACEPVRCDLSAAPGGANRGEVESYGRRRRRRSSPAGKQPTGTGIAGKNLEEDVVVAGAIKITDVFNFRDKDLAALEDVAGPFLRSSSCADRAGLIMAFCIFLFAQLVSVVVVIFRA